MAYQDKAGRNHWTEQLEKVNDVFVPSLRRFERGFDGTAFVERRQALTTIRKEGNCLVCDTAKGGLQITYIASSDQEVSRALYPAPRVAVPKVTRKSFVSMWCWNLSFFLYPSLIHLKLRSPRIIH